MQNLKKLKNEISQDEEFNIYASDLRTGFVVTHLILGEKFSKQQNLEGWRNVARVCL